MKKRVIAVLLSAIMALSICSSFAFADETPTIEELLERIEALEERVAALESGSSVEVSSEQIIEDLTTYTWGDIREEGQVIINFDADNKGLIKLKTSNRGEQELSLSWIIKGNQIVMTTDDGELWAEYNNESGSPSIYIEEEEVILTPIDK